MCSPQITFEFDRYSPFMYGCVEKSLGKRIFFSEDMLNLHNVHHVRYSDKNHY